MSNKDHIILWEGFFGVSNLTHWVIDDQNGRTCRPHSGTFDSRLRHHKAFECVCVFGVANDPHWPPCRSVHLPETRELREEGDVGDEEATATKARCSRNGNHPPAIRKRSLDSETQNIEYRLSQGFFFLGGRD